MAEQTGSVTVLKVLFVCTGNICRSPMAEVVTRSLAECKAMPDGSVLGDHLAVSSAGTGPWHEGEPMNPKAAAALDRAGYLEHDHIAHQIAQSRLPDFDLIIPLDRSHHQNLRSLCPDARRMALLRSFDPASGAAADVPDPYYGDDAEFDSCLAMIEAGCRGVVVELARMCEGTAPT
jgi:protein-tyrosine phosphatase